MSHTIEWPCARHLPKSPTLYQGDFGYCLMRVRIYSSLKRWDGFQVWRIRRDSDDVVVAQSALGNVNLDELDVKRDEVRLTILMMKEANGDGR